MSATRSRRDPRRASRGLVLAGGLASLLLACTSAPEPPRNVILVSLDTVGARHLSSYGYASPTSPNLDALAEQGVLFETAVAPSPWTLPSHAAMLTGLYPSRTGARTLDQSVSKDVVTLASLLATHGFESAAFVNGIFLARPFGLDQGFDTYELLQPDHSPEGAARRITDRAIAWLDERGEERSFLFVHYFDVHSDYRSEPVYEEMFGAERGRVDGTTEQLVKVVKGEFALDPADVRVLERLYDAGIRQLDAELARLISLLEERGRLDDSLLIVTSDHGEQFLEHGNVMHGDAHYDELLLVPLILRGPTLPKGVRIDSPVSLVDLVPTITSVLELPESLESDGIDLRPLWEDQDRERRDRFVFAEGGPLLTEDTLRSVRSSRYKLIVDLATQQRQLYDLVDDPGETRDVQAIRPEVVRTLSAALEPHVAGQREDAPRLELSPEAEEQLRQLGYQR